jgi:hypothetical protein
MADSVRFPIEAGHVLLFARSIGDESPEYQAAMHGEAASVPAPPTFVQASAQFTPGYRLRPASGERWFGSGADNGFMPAEDGGALHAEQHFEYRKPVVAGMVLTATTRPGEQWTKQGRRGGTLTFSETITEYRDSSGELIATARSVGVRTERVVEREG